MTARAVQRLRLTVVALLLVFMVFAQSAGNTLADTKIDLVVDPGRFLTRALQLWDPIGNGGQLQNQAYGYLFPMGPFFAFGHWIGLAPWVIQRAFESAIIVGAFLGVVRLSRLLGMPGFWPRVAAGLAYALAPRTLSELTSISAELMPVAALPWVLIPLVTGSRDGSPRRAAMRSGVALLFAGGVNAAATLAIFPAPILWLATRPPGRRKRRLSAWWAVAVLLACAWWLVPLVQLGRFSPPFLDWIESASSTTIASSLQATLRGADQWVAYLGPNTWPGGWILAAAPLVILATVAVAAAGLAGLARRDVRHRRFLLAVLACGLVGVTFGHVATIGPPGAVSAQGLLDGLLVAFRNVHKFDPLVRLPLAIGFGQVLARARVPKSWALGSRGIVLPARSLAQLLVVCVGLIAVTPALTGQLATKPRVTTEPGWWRQTADWLAQNDAQGRALVVPGSASPAYLWGSTVDDALQPVARTPWALRNAVPLAPAGYIRLLDRVEDMLAAGRADPTLAPLLRRAGISSVVLRNDLSAASSQATSLSLVRATLDASAGLRLAAEFGPKVNGNDQPANLIDLGLGDLRASVQIYRVADASPTVDLAAQSGVVRANGSSDDLPTLIEAGLPPTSAVVFDADDRGQLQADTYRVLDDGIRKRQATFGGFFAKSPTMDLDQPYAGQRRAYDYLPATPGPLSAWTYTGIASVRASSSGSDLLAFLNRSPSHQPWSALDADPDTAWMSGSLGGALGQWLDVTLPQAIPAGTIRARFTTGLGDSVSQVLISTDAGFRYVTVQPGDQEQQLPMPAGTARHVRITVTGMASGGRGGSAGISSLLLPGVTPARSLAVGGAAAPEQLSFAIADGQRSECLTVHAQAACDPTFVRGGEEDAQLARTFTLRAGNTYAASAMVRLRPGAALDALLDNASEIKVAASSTASSDPRVRPGAVVDRDDDTTWSPAPGDVTPRLTLRLPKPTTLGGIRLTTSAEAPVGRPVRVEVTAGSVTWSGAVPDDGLIRLPRLTQANTVTIAILTSSLRNSTSSQTFRTRLLPVGISEVALSAAPAITTGAAPLLTITCADGPLLFVDGTPTRLQVSASRAEALAGRAVTGRSCDTQPLDLSPGEHEVSLGASNTTLPLALTLTSARSPASLAGVVQPGSEQVRRWGATSRTIEVDAQVASLLVVRENFNSGWQASLDGQRLDSVELDGWQQAYVLPPGTHGLLRLEFTPQRAFVVGLVGGLVAALLVCLLAWWPPRRRYRGPPAVTGSGRYLDARVNGRVALAASGLVLAALSGLAGPVTLLVLAVTAAVLWSWRRGIPSWFPALALMVGAVLVATVPSVRLFTEANSNLTQLLCVAALAAVFVGDGSERPNRAP